MQASHTLKTRFSNFRKVVPLISSGATRNRKENLKWHTLMYSIGGWTGEENIVWSANAINLAAESVRTNLVRIYFKRDKKSRKNSNFSGSYKL